MSPRRSSSLIMLWTLGGVIQRRSAACLALGGRPAVDQGVGVDEGQVLALGIGESGRRRSCHAIRIWI